jgi:hypothetical protein
MSYKHANERVLQVHTAGTSTEAMVIRSMLESAGIATPGSVSSDPFPMREPPKGTHGVEIYVLESQADEARRLIAGHLNSSERGSSDRSAE